MGSGTKALIVGGIVAAATVGSFFAVPALVTAIGFGVGGVIAGSAAACIQSAVYGGAVVAGSMFAILQSIGATCFLVASSPVIAATAAVVGVIGAVIAAFADE